MGETDRHKWTITTPAVGGAGGIVIVATCHVCGETRTFQTAPVRKSSTVDLSGNCPVG